MDHPFYVNVRVRINTFLRSINKNKVFHFSKLQHRLVKISTTGKYTIVMRRKNWDVVPSETLSMFSILLSGL